MTGSKNQEGNENGEMLMGIGEKILDHYAKYLGDFVGSEQYRFGDRIIQILGFPNVFKDCMVFATFGMAKFPEEIRRRCEVGKVIRLLRLRNTPLMVFRRNERWLSM